MKQAPQKKPARQDHPWLAWEIKKVRNGIKGKWKEFSQQELAEELQRSREAVQQKSHNLRQSKSKSSAKRVLTKRRGKPL